MLHLPALQCNIHQFPIKKYKEDIISLLTDLFSIYLNLDEVVNKRNTCEHDTRIAESS